MRQPLLGIVATVLVVAAALAFSLAIGPTLLMSWVTLLFVAGVPAMIILMLALHGRFPARIAELRQPLRGFAFTVLTAAVAIPVGWLANAMLGAGMMPPTPLPVMYLILAVPVAIWLIVGFGAWPFSRLARSPGALAVSVLIAAYLLAWLLYRLLFDFHFLADAPFYAALTDPAGMFMAWYPLTAALNMALLLLAMVLLDFWPLSPIAARWPSLGSQPSRGLVLLAALGLTTAALWKIGMGGLGMDIVGYNVRVVISGIFGVFVVLVMFQGAPFIRIAQPWRGLVLIAAAILLAVCAYGLYARLVPPELATAGSDSAVWIASAMLGVTFPVMVIWADFLGLWPLAIPARQHG